MEDLGAELGMLPLIDKKPPRKPRPSELAKKAAKAAAKVVGEKSSQPKAKKAVKKTAPKKKAKVVVKRAGPKKIPYAGAPKKRAVKKAAASRSAPKRGARIDIRATPAERKRIVDFATKRGLTLTGAVMFVIGKMK
jgi:hypothetical protein